MQAKRQSATARPRASAGHAPPLVGDIGKCLDAGMRQVQVFTTTAFAVVALCGVGCSEIEEPDAGDIGDVKVVQGDLEQAVDDTGVCTATDPRRACSRRSYARSTLDPAFDPSSPARVTFDAGTRFELTVLRDRPGSEPKVIWRDEEHCIDSACWTRPRSTGESLGGCATARSCASCCSRTSPEASSWSWPRADKRPCATEHRVVGQGRRTTAAMRQVRHPPRSDFGSAAGSAPSRHTQHSRLSCLVATTTAHEGTS